MGGKKKSNKLLEGLPAPSSHPTLLSCVSSPARGSAIAKIVGSNAGRLAHFDPRVTMWVFEEDIGGRKLTEIINTQHENVKYLPGHKLPPNVVSSNCVRREKEARKGYAGVNSQK